MKQEPGEVPQLGAHAPGTAKAAAPEGTAHRMALLPRAQGLYLVLTGIWPLVHYRSFEAVTGPKADPWLVKCVGGLAATMGYVQLRAGKGPEGRAAARRTGMGAALTFASVDVLYGGSGRISRIYLLESAVELLWLLAWRARDKSGAPRLPGAGAATHDIYPPAIPTPESRGTP